MTILSECSTLNALVVGATQGIGFEFVQQLLADARVQQLFATYRSTDTAQALLTLSQQHPQRLHCIQMDLCHENQISQGLQTLRETLPKDQSLHFVMNCVGLLHSESQQPEKALRQLDPDHLMTYFQVNSIGPALLAKHLLPLLKHKEHSLFATISAKIGSIEDNRIGGWYGYRASKAALNMFLKTASIEYKRRSPNTAIVLLHPGTTDTRLSQPFQRGVPPEKLFPVQKTVSLLLNVLSNVSLADSGQFFSWDGSRLPW